MVLLHDRVIDLSGLLCTIRALSLIHICSRPLAPDQSLARSRRPAPGQSLARGGQRPLRGLRLWSGGPPGRQGRRSTSPCAGPRSAPPPRARGALARS